MLDEPDAASVLGWYRELLSVRHRHIVPLLPALARGGSFEQLGDAAVRIHWQAEGGAELILAANLKDEPAAGIETPPGNLLWQEGHVDAGGFGPWSLRWSLRA